MISYAKDIPPVTVFEYISYLTLIDLLLAIILLLNKYVKGTRENEFIQEILNTQDHIAVVTNGRKIKMVNEVFLKFFGIKDLEEFTNDAACICDKFLVNEAFFHLGKVPVGEAWIKELTLLDASSQIVAMVELDTHQMKIFNVFVSPLQSIHNDVRKSTSVLMFDIDHFKTINDT